MRRQDSSAIRSSHQLDRAARARLQLRIVIVLLLASLLPLLLAGFGTWLVLGQLIEQKTFDLHRNVVETHGAAIERYLAERTRALELAVQTQSYEQLVGRDGDGALAELLDHLNAVYEDGFVDLGVIGAHGEHAAYVGPYDLMDRNYSDAAWFRDVMAVGHSVSDVFLGYREVPHAIIAVRRREPDRTWVLRATINSEQFEGLVQTGYLGETGDVFLVNRQGIYQTPPRVGAVLARAPITRLAPHQGVAMTRATGRDGAELVQTTTWINGGRWMLVVQQDEAEITAPLRSAMLAGVVVVALAFVVVVLTTWLSTRHLTNLLAEVDARRAGLAEDLLRSAKLASLGELSTGLAHEINNPLAIISAELTNMSDLLTEPNDDGSLRQELQGSIDRCRRQVERSAGITAKMLQFGRHGQSRPRLTELVPKIDEVVALLRRQSEVRNVQLAFEHGDESDIPPVMLDPTELEQVLVNLINNALYAIGRDGRIAVSLRRLPDSVRLEIEDDGCGMKPEDLPRAFQPFFTTKPVGQGTGLGLAVCYGLVQKWGGTIDIESEVGRGTTVSIAIPVPQSPTAEAKLPSATSTGTRNDQATRRSFAPGR
jgi:two-component system NtrC family sensor kinase